MTTTLVPIFICVVLPVAIVLILALTTINNDNKRAQILIKAIESGNNIDADKLAEALRKPKKSPREILNLRLLRGCIFTLLGLGLDIVAIFNLCSGDSDVSSDVVTIPLIFSAPMLAIGIGYLVEYFVTRKQVEDK